jgi:hypothetical protein
MTDTSPEFAEMVRKRMMERSGEERLLMGLSMFDMARAIMVASFPPNLSPVEMKTMLYERTYGESPPAGAVEQWIEIERRKSATCAAT